MESLLQQARDKGFHILDSAVDSYVADDGNLQSYPKFERFLLDNDLRKLLTNTIPDNVNTLDAELAGPMVLQVLSVVNISQPSKRQSEDTQPRVLQVRLTDGTMKCVGIEREPVSDLSASHTAPGTKILIQNCRVLHGKLLLTPSSCRVLGGRVDQLYTSWRANREAAKVARGYQTTTGSQADGAPPPFQAFSTTSRSTVNNNSSSNSNDATTAATDNNSRTVEQRQPKTKQPPITQQPQEQQVIAPEAKQQQKQQPHKQKQPQQQEERKPRAQQSKQRQEIITPSQQETAPAIVSDKKHQKKKQQQHKQTVSLSDNVLPLPAAPSASLQQHVTPVAADNNSASSNNRSNSTREGGRKWKEKSPTAAAPVPVPAVPQADRQEQLQPPMQVESKQMRPERAVYVPPAARVKSPTVPASAATAMEMSNDRDEEKQSSSQRKPKPNRSAPKQRHYVAKSSNS